MITGRVTLQSYTETCGRKDNVQNTARGERIKYLYVKRARRDGARSALSCASLRRTTANFRRKFAPRRENRTYTYFNITRQIKNADILKHGDIKTRQIKNADILKI